MSRKVVIIGAGAAGLACANRLISHGYEVSIFDKSRGVGGRIASRRIENGIFNHGASSLPNFRYYNNLPEDLRNLLETAAKQKILIPNGKCFTSFASMKTFTSYLSKGIDIKKGSEVTSAKRLNHGVELNFKNTSKIQLKDDFLVFAIPQPQVLNLLQNDFPEIFALVQPVKMYASVSGLFAFDKSLTINQSFIENDCIFGLHENSRVGQNFKLDCWTIHSKKEYGLKLSHLDKSQIKKKLFQDFKQLRTINFPDPIYAEGHRWLYGFTEEALNENYIFNLKQKIGICGDWCLGDSVLDALISGTLLADKILTSVIE